MSRLPAGAISAVGVAKRYRTIANFDALPNLRETIAGAFRGRGEDVHKAKEFWALRGVSFEVKPGEVVGILGRNGAGKSTLLKILSRIVEPTSGQIAMAGRLGCLLEVGTGFHRELTGRENIFLNGAILGMSRRETRAKLDAIVEFSGIGAFIDTPVKAYSSGMYLRLGFAVAAHVDPEILIIDEVLSVGDAAFQEKCIKRVGQLVNDGRTVLIVSHQLALIQKLCTRAILIDRGVVTEDGQPAEIVSRYLAGLERNSPNGPLPAGEREGRGRVHILGAEVSGSSGAPLVAGSAANFAFSVTSPAPAIECSFTIYDIFGEAVSSFDTSNRAPADMLAQEVRSGFRCEIPSLPLRPGRYRINAALTASDGEIEDRIEGCCSFDVLPGLIEGREAIAASRYGTVDFPHKWTSQ